MEKISLKLYKCFYYLYLTKDNKFLIVYIFNHLFKFNMKKIKCSFYFTWNGCTLYHETKVSTYNFQNLAIRNDDKYSACCRTFNAHAAGTLTVGS